MAMPIYEYVCRECDSEFEELVQGGRQPRCPSCNSGELEKKFSSFAVAADSLPMACEAQGPCTNCKDLRRSGVCAMEN
jgi:putative FmdB family regulatory protein